MADQNDERIVLSGEHIRGTLIERLTQINAKLSVMLALQSRILAYMTRGDEEAAIDASMEMVESLIRADFEELKTKASSVTPSPSSSHPDE